MVKSNRKTCQRTKSLQTLTKCIFQAKNDQPSGWLKLEKNQYLEVKLSADLTTGQKSDELERVE